MAAQELDIWVGGEYSMDQFRDELCSKMIWGPSQEVAVWGVDKLTGRKERLTSNAEFVDFISDQRDANAKCINLTVKVVDKTVVHPFDSGGSLEHQVLSALQRK